MISNDTNKISDEEINSIGSSVRDRLKVIGEKNKSETEQQAFFRRTGQYASRAGEILVGASGNLKKAFQQTKDYLQSFLPEKLRTHEENLPQPEEGSFEHMLMNPLTSSELRETATKDIAEKIGGSREYFEPRGKKEEFVGDLTQDITSAFSPGTGQFRFMTKLGAPILGNLVKQGLDYVGADKSTAEKAKLGTMLVTSIAGQSNPGQFASERISQGKNMVPQNATLDVTNLANRFLPLYYRLRRGLRTPSKTRAMEGMRDLAQQVQNNRMSLHSLMQARDDINEWIAEAGGWDIPVAIRNPTLRNLNEFKRAVIRTIDENLSTRFPQAAELYRTGYEAAAVNHQSNAISNFIERNFGRKAASIGAKMLFPAIGGSAAFLPKMAIAGAGLYPLYKSGQILYRVSNSPTLGRYYRDVISNSLRGNAPAMVHSMSKLDKELAKQEEKDRKKNGPSVEEFKSKFKNRSRKKD